MYPSQQVLFPSHGVVAIIILCGDDDVSAGVADSEADDAAVGGIPSPPELAANSGKQY